MIEGKYNKWIVIFLEFDLVFMVEKLKKSLVFAELISGFPCDGYSNYDESIPYANIFLISSQDHWYGDFIVFSRL